MKKIVLFLCIAALLMGVLAGCGKKPRSADPTAASATNSTEAEATVTETEPAISHNTMLDDRSYFDGNGIMRVDHHYTRIELSGDAEALDTINGKLKERSDAFLAESYENDPLVKEYKFSDAGECFQDYADCDVTWLNGGLLSITEKAVWWMGGVSNTNFRGMTFDLETGEAVTLPQLMRCDEAEAAAQLKQIAWEKVSEEYGDKLLPDAKQTIDGKPLDKMEFAIVDGELTLFYETYSLMTGADGAVTVRTGILF